MMHHEQNKEQCAALRGLAIIGIFLHNYCHWLAPAVKENEYTFVASRAEEMLEVLFRFDSNWVMHLFSFFGHYGVPVFLFLSAYGLVKKYEEKPLPTAHPSPKWEGRGFIVSHFHKLFMMMIVGFGLFVLVDNITPGRHTYAFVDVVAQLFMVNNLMPEPHHVIWPGPYWFFGLMLQLYVVYRLLLFGKNRRTLITALLLTGCCWLLQAMQGPTSPELNYLRYNCIGGMLPFCAGLLWARYGECHTGGMNRRGWLLVLLASLLVIIFGSLSFSVWLWIPLFVCSASVAVAKLMPGFLCHQLAWVGGISAAIFVLHPISRKILIPISRHGDIYAGLALYIVATLVIAACYHKMRSKK